MVEVSLVWVCRKVAECSSTGGDGGGSAPVDGQVVQDDPCGGLFRVDRAACGQAVSGLSYLGRVSKVDHEGRWLPERIRCAAAPGAARSRAACTVNAPSTDMGF